MIALLTRSLANKLIQLLLFVSLPLLSQAQTVIVNYDFNGSSPTAPLTTAPGITSTASTSAKTAVFNGGTVTGPGAYTPNVSAGNALTLTALNAASTDYFQVDLAGSALVKHSAFQLYFQSLRTTMGPTSLALFYSLNGAAYVSAGQTVVPGLFPVFNEVRIGLTGALDAPTSLSFRLVVGGSTGGNVRLDNFQVQATNTVDPLLSTLAPASAEAGTPGFNLTLTGSNFQPDAVVSFNGRNLLPDYKSTTSLEVMLPTAVIATAGNYPVIVVNPGGAASAASIFTVTPALVRWTGSVGSDGSGSWFDAGNWSTGSLPKATDEVALDHRYVRGSYKVIFDKNEVVSLKSLQVNPDLGDSIFVEVPVGNTVSPAALTMGSTDATPALKIYNKGVVTNASGLTSSAGIDIVGTAATFFLYNGGSYRQASSAGHKQVIENLSSVAGTEQGIFDFQLPGNVTGSYTLSIANRKYGTLIFRNRPGQKSTSYPGSANGLIVRGNFLIGPGAVVIATINTANEVQLLGNVQVQGTLLFKNGSSGAPSQVVLAGGSPQAIGGDVAFEPGIGLSISNSAGVKLAAPLILSGQLALAAGTLTTTATNLLTLSPAASISGGSPTSYINGPLARQVNAGALSKLVFPVGSGPNYRPLTLDATAQDATAYLVTQTEGPAPDYQNLPISTSALFQLTRVARARSYTITPTPATASFSGTATLTFGPDDQVNAPVNAGLTVGKNSGSGWQNIGSSNVAVVTPVPADGYASGTITSGMFTSFGTLALASTNADAAVNPLPVSLINFTARRQAADVRLSWTTASELRSARFDVQRSPDGQAFITVATAAAQGTTGLAHHYAALDPNAPPGPLYYRLAQVDIDGQTTFSPTVALLATGSLALYPNPARDYLTVPAAAGTLVRVLDLAGRVAQTVALPPSGEVSVSSLPAGTYWLQVGEDARPLRFSKE